MQEFGSFNDIVDLFIWVLGYKLFYCFFFYIFL